MSITVESVQADSTRKTKTSELLHLSVEDHWTSLSRPRRISGPDSAVQMGWRLFLSPPVLASCSPRPAGLASIIHSGQPRPRRSDIPVLPIERKPLAHHRADDAIVAVEPSLLPSQI